jgi:hypothetical protein
VNEKESANVDEGSANISFEQADKTDARILDLNDSEDDNRVGRNSHRKRSSIMESVPAQTRQSRLSQDIKMPGHRVEQSVVGIPEEPVVPLPS